MSTLDWQEHDADIVSFVRKTTDYFLRTSASTGELLRPDQGILLRNNLATPANLLVLLEYLTDVTDQVDGELESRRIACVSANMPLDTCMAGSSTWGPINKDFQSWAIRLQNYKNLTELALERNPEASGDEDPELWTRVTKPLLLGLFPGENRQRRLDAVTPLILAWQIEVAEDAYRDAREQLWEDLKEGAKGVVKAVTSWGVGLGLLAVFGLALGYGYGRTR